MSSIPPSDPAHLRHLGAGGPGPVRSPLILGLVALLVLVALPLYLLRRPKPVGPVEMDAGAKVERGEGGGVVRAGGLSSLGRRARQHEVSQRRVEEQSPGRGELLS